MSVRLSLLAILDQGACYGYQLRAEFDRRTGSTWPLNVGQIYNTLDRLERDGLVSKGDVDAEGHVYWHITDAGAAEVRDWWAAPVERAGGTRDELAIKVAVAATLPGADAAGIIATQRAQSVSQLEALTRAAGAGVDAAGPEVLAAELVNDSLIAHAEAELRWLDRAEQLLAQHPRHSMDLGLSAAKPKRGRPAKSAS